MLLAPTETLLSTRPDSDRKESSPMAQPIDPRQLRPRRLWYGIAVFIAVLSIALGIGGLAVSDHLMDNTYPDFQTYSGKEVSLIEVDASRDYGLYVPKNARQFCTVGSLTATPRDEEPWEFTRSGQRWVHVDTVRPNESGPYSVKCDAPTYGFGDPPPFDQYRLQAGSGLAALLGLPCLGLTICFAIALVTGLRRGRHKVRLQAARTATTPNPGPPNLGPRYLGPVGSGPALSGSALSVQPSAPPAPPMTPPPLPTVRRRPASIAVAVLMIGLLVAHSAIAAVLAVLNDSGGSGANIFTAFLAFVLGVALWQGTRVGWIIALAIGVIRLLLTGLAFLVDGDDPSGGWIFAVIGIVIGVLLVAALLLPASRDYCWGEKPGL
ncbi:hypothetical protein CryarDRAFT_3445 [Cryptosporangium arvum DSM 44712]|uniref:Uncharacterized protein n=2 Tax=Cryptosporangium TaxID=65502 RepID=A0A010YQ37_9ACTN|nr:hypothetical protein CryarDRAFT_3445 [Cryptosporangium arvum DSM 44712]